MGAGCSNIKDLASNPYLKRFIGDEPITPNDPFWNQFLSFSIKKVYSKTEYKNVENALSPLFDSLMRNNASSGNINALLQVFLSRASELKQFAAQFENEIFTWQCHNALLLLQFVIKHLFETLQPEDEVISILQHSPKNISGPVDDMSNLVESLCTSLIEIIVDVPLGDATYSLHFEATLSLIVLASSHLYNFENSRYIILRMLLKGRPSLHACLFVKTLINRFIEFDNPPPVGNSSSFLGLASGIWNALTTSLSLSEQDDSGEVVRFPPLALQSLLLLLIISNHFTSEQGPSNPYRLSLLHAQDFQDSQETSSTKNVSFKTNYMKLYKRIHLNLHSPKVTLLLYILLHKNINFRTFVLAQTDIELLIVPILKILYNASTNNSHHIYMSLIILLIFSEDDCFNKTIHDINLKEIAWYTERQLSQISLGGLIILVVIRTITFNMTKMRDKYLHTNCLAALANMSSHFRSLHPYVAQKIVNLFENLAKKHSKTCESLQESKDLLETPITDLSDAMSDITVLEEVLRMVLEIINSTLTNQLVNNHDLVYTLLYKRHLFELFSSHLNFEDVCHNIQTILSFFMGKLESSSTDCLSVEEVQAIIQNGVMQFSKAKLRKFPELKFKYVEENEPEEFFIPYVWSLVYESSGIFWDYQKIALFSSLDSNFKLEAS